MQSDAERTTSKGNSYVKLLRYGPAGAEKPGMLDADGTIRDLSAQFYKAHEILGLLTFFGLYFGIICLLVPAMLRQKAHVFTLMLIVGPLLAIGITQFWLYLDQRDLGWVDTSWRAMGIPVWLSFAFWQWLAIGLLWLGLGLLRFTAVGRDSTTDL